MTPASMCPVTVLKLDDCQVVAHRTSDKNGYTACSSAPASPRSRTPTKAQRGHFAVANVEPKRKLVEFRVADEDMIPVGAELTADHFVPASSSTSPAPRSARASPAR